MLDKINKYLIAKPKSGISVIDNITGKKLCKFITLEQMKIKGCTGLQEYLAGFKSKGHRGITVFLKIPNGSSKAYVVQNKKRVQLTLGEEKTNNTNLEVSPSSGNAPIRDSIGASLLNSNTTKNMLNGIPQEVLQTYSQSERAKEIIPKHNDLLAKYEELREKHLKLEMQHELLKVQPKTLVSEPMAQMGMGVISKIFDVMEARAGAGALASPQQNQSFTTAQTNLLDKIKQADFNDEYCELITNIITKGDDDSSFYPKVIEHLK